MGDFYTDLWGGLGAGIARGFDTFNALQQQQRQNKRQDEQDAMQRTAFERQGKTFDRQMQQFDRQDAATTYQALQQEGARAYASGDWKRAYEIGQQLRPYYQQATGVKTEGINIVGEPNKVFGLQQKNQLPDLNAGAGRTDLSSTGLLQGAAPKETMLGTSWANPFDALAQAKEMTPDFGGTLPPAAQQNRLNFDNPLTQKAILQNLNLSPTVPESKVHNVNGHMVLETRDPQTGATLFKELADYSERKLYGGAAEGYGYVGPDGKWVQASEGLGYRPSSEGQASYGMVIGPDGTPYYWNRNDPTDAGQVGGGIQGKPQRGPKPNASDYKIMSEGEMRSRAITNARARAGQFAQGEDLQNAINEEFQLLKQENDAARKRYQQDVQKWEQGGQQPQPGGGLVSQTLPLLQQLAGGQGN